MSAAVITPTYNEIGNIGPFLSEVRRAVPDAQVLVVDDNSPDGTGDAVAAHAADDPRVHLLSRPSKLGLGAAYRAGFAHVFSGALGDVDVIVAMDADLSHDPAEIPNMLARIDAGADAVIGSRYVPGGGIVDWPVHRLALSRWGNLYTRAVLGLEVRDCTSGFRAFRTATLESIEPSTTVTEGYAFQTEVLRRLQDAGAVVDEIPIEFANRTAGRSKMSIRIIAESMSHVTWWGVRRVLHRD